MSLSQLTPTSLGPNIELPEGLKQWRILLLVTSMNSFAQKVWTYLQDRGIVHLTVHMMGDDGNEVVRIAEKWKVDLILCPFLTKRILAEVYTRWITLVVHPGPPGDAGPSSLDWVLLGDTGLHASSTDTLTSLISTPASTPPKQRPYWGTIVFQANEHLDGGSIWAWEQYKLPNIGSITKAGLYQGEHSRAAILSVTTALIRVYETANEGVDVKPKKEWSERSVTLQCGFLGGPTHDRPLLQSKQRKPDWKIHTADDVLRIINAGDSQPGAQIPPLTSDSKTSLFVYGGHLHVDTAKVPHRLYRGEWDDIPSGTPIAQRSGAVLFKTVKGGRACAIWITHGRVPKKAGSPLEPKIPLAKAIIASGHGSILEGVGEWDLGQEFEVEEGVWKEVYVKSVDGGERGLAQLVHWDFYNGAFSTTQCQLLLRALRWAVAPERGNVTMLVLMGGHYFSNGIALNIIESHPSPPHETWANINAIDDIVEFLISDISPERSPFLSGDTPLCERGIVTVACLRGNAAAGGVALAAACDVVVAGRGVVLNPAYRGMGLHGSEFHSYSYLTRCGPERAAKMLREMIPQNTGLSRETGLVDIELGTYDSSTSEIEELRTAQVRMILHGNASLLADSPTTANTISPFRCAPWCRPSSQTPYSHATPLTIHLTTCKTTHYTSPHRSHPPLIHYRTEELSQMLLDSFHPVRSQRYHTRRYAFIRKLKCGNTPCRYALHEREKGGVDEEEKEEFDHAEGWVRGEEWGWVGLDIPECLASSESTRIVLYTVDQRGLASPTMSIESSRAEYSESIPTSPTSDRSSHDDTDLLSQYQYQVLGSDKVGLGGTTSFASDRSLSTVLGEGDTDSQGPKTPSTGGKANLGINQNYSYNLNIYPSGSTRARESSNTLPISDGVEEADYGNPMSTPSKVGKIGKGERVMETPQSPSPKRADLGKVQGGQEKGVQGVGKGVAGYVKPTIEGLVQVEFPCLYDVGDGAGED